MLGSTYPLLDIFWTLLELAVLVLWVSLVIIIFGDIFRSADLSGLAKALWTLLVLILPWFGVVIYVVARGSSMLERWGGGRPHPGRGGVYAPPTARSNYPMANGGMSEPLPM